MKRPLIPPTAAEEAAINAGIAADADTFEPSDADFARMRPAAEAIPALIAERRRRPARRPRRP